VLVTGRNGKVADFSAYWEIDGDEWRYGPDERPDKAQAFLEVVGVIQKALGETAEIKGTDGKP